MVKKLKSQRGSVVLVAMCFSIILAISVSSYLALSYSSYRLSTRLQNEDQARQLAQIGLEEALWALNQGVWNQSGPGSNGAWITSGTSRTITISYPGLAAGGDGTLELTISNYAAAGPITWPKIISASTIVFNDGRTLKKVLTSFTAPAPLFNNAIASLNREVRFLSSGTVDSWNSNNGSVPYSFTSGAAANYAAVVSGVSDGGGNGVVLNGALINGYVTTSGNQVQYVTSGTPKGQVKGPTTAATTDFDESRVGKSLFVPTVEVITPSTATAGTVTGANQTIGPGSAILPSVWTSSTDLNITGNVQINEPAILVVQGSLQISSTGKITINKPDGALQIFVSNDCTIGGAAIDNQTNDPKKLSIFCTSPSTTDSLSYTATSDFCGVIYCVNKPISIRQNITLYGALLSGQWVHFSFSATSPVVHFDTSLRNVRFLSNTPYILKQITES